MVGVLVGAFILLVYLGVKETTGAATDIPIPTAGFYHVSSGNDFIDALAEAIARAEGYYAPGPHDGHSLPYFHNNPGDLMTGGVNITYPDANSGWQALYNKLRNILNGGSHVYTLDMSIHQVARTWTGGDNPGPWANTVVSYLQQQGYDVTGDNSVSDLAAYA